MANDPYSLDLLVENVSPDPVGWFPFASGWWFFFAASAIWMIYAWIVWLIRYRQNAYRRIGIKLLCDLQSVDSLEDGVRQADQILKRVAMVTYSRDAVASMWGNEWVQFLCSSTAGGSGFNEGGKNGCFNKSIAAALATINVQSLPDTFSREEYRELLAAASAWVKNHSSEEA